MILARGNWILYCFLKTFKGLCTKSGSWFLLSDSKRSKAESLVYLIGHSDFGAVPMFLLTQRMGIPLACLLKWVVEIRGPCKETRLYMGWVGSLRSLDTIAVTTIPRREAGSSAADKWRNEQSRGGEHRRRQHLAPPCVPDKRKGVETPWNMSGNTVNTQDKPSTLTIQELPGQRTSFETKQRWNMELGFGYVKV